jgi:hypothetical protein
MNMARLSGVTTETWKRFVLDAGQVRKNYVDGTDTGELIGATRGGSTFTIEREIRNMGADGIPGPIKGADRVIKVNAKLVMNFIEFTSDILMMAIPGSSKTDSPSSTPTHDEITAALEIEIGEYLTNVVILANVNGSEQPIICGIKNALANGALEIGFSDGDESGLKVEMIAHFDPATLASEPWFIMFPQDVNPTTTAGA